MAFASDNRIQTLPLADRFAGVVAQIQENLRKRKVYRATLNELYQLSEAELADIGLNRSVLRSVALEAAKNA